jgi:hypothetical protein
LKANDPRLTKKQFKRVKEKMATSGFRKRFDNFKLASQLEWNDELEGQFNRLNRENAAVRKSVESKLRKLCVGGCKWSPAITMLRNTVELWCMLVKRKSKVKTSVTLIRRLLRKVPQARNAFLCALSEAVRNRNQAFMELKAVSKQEAISMRHVFQGTLAEALALKKGTLAETEAKQLRTIARQRRQGRAVKRMRGRGVNSRVTKLCYMDADGTRVQCDTQLEMETACLDENDFRFSQCDPAPPMQEPTTLELGFLGDTEAVDDMLAGNCVSPEGTDQHMRKLLEEMCMPQNIRASVSSWGTFSTLRRKINRDGRNEKWRRPNQRD